MKISFLYKFLIGNMSVKQLKDEISENIKVYKLNLQKKGASVIFSIDEDLQFTFKKEYLLKLCNDYLNQELNFWELSYIVDCITLSESIIYENEMLSDFLESIITSEGNEKMNRERIKRIKNDTTAFKC